MSNTDKRTIGVVTVARSDYGIYRPILKAIDESPDLNLYLYAGGMHLSPQFGLTIREIEAEGFSIDERIDFSLSSDTPEGIGKSIGLGMIGFAQAYSRYQPDILLVLGDRFEMLAAVVAAMPFVIPIAHLHGGESTEGLIDESIRHSITKMSHLHFVSTDAYKERVIQLGEEPWRVIVSGAPSLDNLQSIQLLDKDELESITNISLSQKPLLVTFHPVTLEYEHIHYYIRELMTALAELDQPIIFTYPNADTYGHIIIQEIEQFCTQNANARLVENLGTHAYFSLMNYAAAMIGNSSSGIIEAASFGLPVLNIGSRQKGRLHGGNVVDVDYSNDVILAGIHKLLSPEFRQKIEKMKNPYGDGNATERILNVLRNVSLTQGILHKKFYQGVKE